jgi:hypothetical protein
MTTKKKIPPFCFTNQNVQMQPFFSFKYIFPKLDQQNKGI